MAMLEQTSSLFHTAVALGRGHPGRLGPLMAFLGLALTLFILPLLAPWQSLHSRFFPRLRLGR